MNNKVLILGVVFVFSFLLVSTTSLAASCSLSQSGSDSGTIMQGESFVVEVSGLSTSSTVEAQLMLPSGFSVDEDETKTKSGVSSISWTSVVATNTKEGQSISISLTVDNVPQGEVSCSPDPFDVVTKPNLGIASIGSPDPGTLNESSTFDVDLNIQNTGGTTADLSIGVSGSGMTKVSDTLPSEIDPDGNVAGTVTIRAAEAGSQTVTISAAAANYGNTVERSMGIEVQGIGGTTTTSISDGNGGAGGAAPIGPTLPTQAQSWSNIPANVVKKMEINKPEKIGLKQISISVRNRANNVKITVTKQEGKPADVEVDVSGKAYRYMNIQAENLNESNLREGKIQFEVNKSWINKNKIDPQKVYLNRYKNGQWSRLDTSKLSEGADKITYLAQTPGFSYFAISGEEVAPERPEECPTCPEPGKWSECINGTKTRTNYRCSEATNYTCESYQEEESCKPAKPKGISTWKIGLIVLILIIAGIIAYYYFFQKQEQRF